MTREEILAMKPGQKLNMLVAEKVMRWIAWEEKRGENTYVVFQKQGEREPYRNMKKWEIAKERYRLINYSEIDSMKHVVAGEKYYSTDISAAWEVVEKVTQEYRITLYKLPGGIWSCKYSDFPPILDKTAPEAICKAALLAVMEEPV